MLGVLAPLTLGGRLASSADLDAFYAPFASFLHDRLAAGDLPYWAPGRVLGPAVPGRRAVGRDVPADAARGLAARADRRAARGCDVPLPDRRARRLRAGAAAGRAAARGRPSARSPSRPRGTWSRARPRSACWAARPGWRRRWRWPRPPRAARPSRRGFAIAGLAVVLALHLASGSQQLAALTLATCVIWLVARAGARGGARRAPSRSRSRSALAAVALLPRLELLRLRHGLRLRRPRRHRLAGLRRPPRPRRPLRRLALRDRDALPRRRHARAGDDRRAARRARRRSRCGSCWADRVLAGVGDGPRRLVHGSAAARAHGGGPRAGARHRARAAVRVRAGGVRARPRGGAGPAAWAVGGARAARRRPRGRQRRLRAELSDPARGRLRRARPAALPRSRRCCCSRCSAGDLAWQATHQDQPLRWLRASQVAPAPSGSAAFLLARQRSDGPFRIATAAPEPVLVHQLGAHRSASARALLLDQEALRLGLEDVAGYNPVHLKRYNRLMLASNGGRPVDRHFEFALRPATPQLRSLAVRYYVSPPGEQPAGLPVVYRDRLSVVTRDDGALPFARIVRPGRAPLGRARHLARARPHRDRAARAGPPRGGRPRLSRAGRCVSTVSRPRRWRPVTCARSRCRRERGG